MRMPTHTQEVPVREGLIPFKHAASGKTYETWYKVFGQLSNPSQKPIIVVHGGPGLTHNYLLPTQDLAPLRPVIFYDQLGNGQSTHIHDQPQTFWTFDLFIDELVNLIAFFGIGDDFDFLGHSWGGMLGAEYVLRRKPAGMKHLILSNSLPDNDLWNKSSAQLLSAFPQDVQDAMRAGPHADRKKFVDAMAQFEAVHICTVKPRPQELIDAVNFKYGENGDMTVGDGMYVYCPFGPAPSL